MNQETKERLEQEARKMSVPRHPKSPTMRGIFEDGFLQCAQTILENPQGWDLFTAEQIVEQRNLYRGQVDKIIAEYDYLKSQLSKYKEALERIVNTSSVDAIAFPLQTVSEFYTIAKEALKKQ